VTGGFEGLGEDIPRKEPPQPARNEDIDDGLLRLIGQQRIVRPLLRIIVAGPVKINVALGRMRRGIREGVTDFGRREKNREALLAKAREVGRDLKAEVREIRADIFSPHVAEEVTVIAAAGRQAEHLPSGESVGSSGSKGAFASTVMNSVSTMRRATARAQHLSRAWCRSGCVPW